MYIQADSVGVSLAHRVRSSGVDWRRLVLAGLFVLWTAVGVLIQSDIVLEFVIPFAYSFLVVFGLFGQSFPNTIVFWIGYAIFCFLVATVLVSLFDWVRTRVASVDWQAIR